MATQVQAYLPIRGVGCAIIPEVSLRGKDLWETQLYAQEHGLVVLSSQDVNRIASAVRPDNADRQLIRYAREQTERQRIPLSDKDITDAYGQLHDQVWRQYIVRAKEVLIWVPSDAIHSRVISGKPSTSDAKSILLTDYNVVDRGNGDYVFDINGMTDPLVQVNWLRQDGKITSEMARMLEAPGNAYVWTYPDPQVREGLRALWWYFGVRDWPGLGSDRGPWDGDSYGGSLLGRRLEPNQ